MSQKGFSLLFALLLSAVALLFCAFVFVYSKHENPVEFFSRPKDLKAVYAEKNAQRKDISPKKSIADISPTSGEGMSISNPASEYCIKVGGTLQSEIRGDGGEYSVCEFADNMSCEEWALYRRQCPIGGIKTTGYDNEQQIYCVQQGGKTLAQPNAKCTLPDGKVCLNNALYNGECP